jgi:hypothetical protein
MSEVTARAAVDSEVSDTAVHRASTEPIDSVVKFLVELLGTKLVAYLADVDVSTINRWASASNKPKLETEVKLRNTIQIARELLQVDANYTVRAWFIGMNPQLDDEAPIDMIREGNHRAVIAAARSFIKSA